MSIVLLGQRLGDIAAFSVFDVRTTLYSKHYMQLISCDPTAGKVQQHALGVVFVLLVMLAPAVDALAQYVGDLSPHPYSNNGVGNPYSPGGPYSLNSPAVTGRGPTVPTSPYTWSNVSPKTLGPAVLNRGELLGVLTLPSAPMATTPSRGPYGIALPGSHPLVVGGR